MNEEAIVVSGLSKQYTVYSKAADRLKKAIFKKRDYGQKVNALNNISFSIRKGETFGIIGINGSGKSTLLQILSGIIPPSAGTVAVDGTLAALLELGAGFNPDFTGRENIYISSIIMGLSKEAVEKKISSIIEFADIGDFIDKPVKTYSSGMFIRLAFAININVEADIIIIDEALAVGDIFFRQKCYKKLDELKNQGRSIIIVSHAMNEIEQMCERVLLLHKGDMLYLGSAIEAVKRYYLIFQGARIKECEEEQEVNAAPVTFENGLDESAFFPISIDRQVSNGAADIVSVAVTDEHNRPAKVFGQGEYMVIHAEYRINRKIDCPISGVCFFNEKNIIVHGKSSLQTDSKPPDSLDRGDMIRFHHKIKMDLQAGEYMMETGFSCIKPEDFKNRINMDQSYLDSVNPRITTYSGLGPVAVVTTSRNGYTKLNHHGIADLETDITYDLHNKK